MRQPEGYCNRDCIHMFVGQALYFWQLAARCTCLGGNPCSSHDPIIPASEVSDHLQIICFNSCCLEPVACMHDTRMYTHTHAPPHPHPQHTHTHAGKLQPNATPESMIMTFHCVQYLQILQYAVHNKLLKLCTNDT